MRTSDKTRRIHSATRHERALQHFTNRHWFRRRFADYLNGENSLPTILYLHGDGGNGKSLLLKFLRQNCYLGYSPDWHEPPTGATPIPFAYLNFEEPANGDNRPMEPFFGLLMLRRQLSKYGLRFPLYDFACIWYLKATDQLTKSRLENLFSPEDLELCATLLSLFHTPDATTVLSMILNTVAYAATPLGGLVNTLQARFLPQLNVYIRQRKVDKVRIEEITTMDPRSTLLDELPQLLAEDLNNVMQGENAPPRIVLFFDSHERFWGHEYNLIGDLYHERDRWFRHLLANLERRWGIVTIVAGRDKPKWSDNDVYECRIDPSILEQEYVGNLRIDDAISYLCSAGVQEIEMRDAILAYTQVEAGEHHPLFLSMCVDILRLMDQSPELTPDMFHRLVHTENKAGQLIDLVLRYTDRNMRTIVDVLCAARTFDENIFYYLGKTESGWRPFFLATPALFDAVTDFSFVWSEIGEGSPRYRIHSLIRRLKSERNEPKILDGHAALEKYYRSRAEEGDEAAIVEAIYHAIQLNHKRGLEEWLERFETAFKANQVNLCELLLSIRPELVVLTDLERGMVAARCGYYLRLRTRYELASKEFTNALAAFDKALLVMPDDASAYWNKGEVLQYLGIMEYVLGKHTQALVSYTRAIEVCDQGLAVEPQSSMLKNIKGRTLRSRGDLEVVLSKYADALVSYNQAMEAFNQALLLEPENVKFLNNKGFTLESRGDCEVMLSQHKEARTTYTEAVEVLNLALLLEPNYLMAHNTKGQILISRGNLEARLSKYAEALKSYTLAIDSFDHVLAYAPTHAYALHNKGLALKNRGQVEETLSQNSEALKSYTQATTTIDRLLALAPKAIDTLILKADVLETQGTLETKLSKYAEAFISYAKGTEVADYILDYAPSHLNAHNIRGTICMQRGTLEAKLKRYAEAITDYTQALEDYEHILTLAPNDPWHYHNKGLVSLKRADIELELGKYVQAMESYIQTIDAFSQALMIAPNYIRGYNGRGMVWHSVGELHTKLSRYTEAEESYTQAINDYAQALALAPDDPDLYNNLGTVLQSQGNLNLQRGKYVQAMESYNQALEAFNRALTLDPYDPDLLNNIADVLSDRGKVEAMLARYKAASHSYIHAIQTLDHALALSPGNPLLLNNKGNSLQGRAELEQWLGKYEEALATYRQAIDTYGLSLAVVPYDGNTWFNRGSTMQSCGDLERHLGMYSKALISYRQAGEAFSRAAALESKDLDVYNSWGDVLHAAGDMAMVLGKNAAGNFYYSTALEAYNQALQIAPENEELRENKLLLLSKVDPIQKVLSA